MSSSKILHLNQIYLPWLCISPSADLSETFPNLPYDRMSSSPELKEDSMECPLCMEPLEIDDVNFFPCTCGYQICRFCWHRIRTDENGLCPACRKVRFCLKFDGLLVLYLFVQRSTFLLGHVTPYMRSCPWCALTQVVVDTEYGW